MNSAVWRNSVFVCSAISSGAPPALGQRNFTQSSCVSARVSEHCVDGLIWLSSTAGNIAVLHHTPHTELWLSNTWNLDSGMNKRPWHYCYLAGEQIEWKRQTALTWSHARHNLTCQVLIYFPCRHAYRCLSPGVVSAKYASIKNAMMVIT